MAANELDILLQQGEGYNVEFKQSITKDIPEEICAFVNAAGGTLLIGVKDNNTIILSLRASGLLRRTGSDRTGSWNLILTFPTGGLVEDARENSS